MFSGQLPVIGVEGQLKLKSARIAIKGAGRLGSTLVSMLACTGVSEVVVNDYQFVTRDTLNGSILLHESHMGTPKVLALERAVQHRSHFLLRPAVNPAEFDRACKEATLIVAAANSIRGRKCAARKAIRYGKPLVDVAVIDGRRDLGGHVFVYRPETRAWSACPICLYSPGVQFHRGEGLLYPVVATIAAFALNIIVDLILDPASVGSTNFFAVDLNEKRLSSLAIEKRDDCCVCSQGQVAGNSKRQE
jgi:adenylyltransferase/sulfurtransferase